MDVHVLVYLETTENSVVWCAESPDLPGFYAAAGDLQTLMVRVETAVTEITDQEFATASVVRWQLVGPPANDDAGYTLHGEDRPHGYVAVTTEPRALTAA